MHARFGLSGAVGALAIAALVAVPGAPARANGAPTTFDYTGDVQTYTVPAGITVVRITALGAGGGSARDRFYQQDAPNGGDGAQVTAYESVTPGDVLTIKVGGGGDHGSGITFGGAATSVLAPDLIVVAGGGGGGGYSETGGSGAAGNSPAGGDGTGGGMSGRGGNASGDGTGGDGAGTDQCSGGSGGAGGVGSANGGDAGGPSGGGGGGGFAGGNGGSSWGASDGGIATSIARADNSHPGGGGAGFGGGGSGLASGGGGYGGGGGSVNCSSQGAGGAGGSAASASAIGWPETTFAPGGNGADGHVTNSGGDGGVTIQGYAAPVVTQVSPGSVPPAGGTRVALDGLNFVSGPDFAIAIGDSVCGDPTVVSATRATCVAPAHAAGRYDVHVTNRDLLSGVLPNGLRYATPPTVTSVVPSVGTPAGGKQVRIHGSGFSDQLAVLSEGSSASVCSAGVSSQSCDSASPSVTFGGTAATNVVFISPTELLATAPAHVAGRVDVVVTNPDEQAGRLTGGFTYLAMPGTPGRPTAVAGDRRATVEVVPASSGSLPKSYLVTANHGGRQCTATLPARSCVVTGLTNGVNYRFSARATNAVGSSAPSAQSLPVTPAAPCSLRVFGLTSNAAVPRVGTTTLVQRALTGPGCSLSISTSGGATRLIRGDLRSATFAINRTTGAVTVTTHGGSGLPLRVRVQAVPTGPATTASTPWVRTWRTA